MKPVEIRYPVLVNKSAIYGSGGAAMYELVDSDKRRLFLVDDPELAEHTANQLNKHGVLIANARAYLKALQETNGSNKGATPGSTGFFRPIGDDS